MPSLWPFRRNKKKKLADSDGKLQEKGDVVHVQPSYTTDQKSYIDPNSRVQTAPPSRPPEPLHEKIAQPVAAENEPGNQDISAIDTTITNTKRESVAGEEPLVDISNLAGARENNLDFATFGAFDSAPLELNFTTQPLYGVPTLKSKRSNVTGEIVRIRSGRSKSSLKDRAKEIKALPPPIPIPRRPSSFSGSPLARDSKKFAGGLNQKLQRPTSEVSLPMAESLRTSFSGDTGSRSHSYKVSAFDALSPRPTIRYGERPTLPSVREKTSRSALRKGKGPQTLEESMPPDPRARIKEMADDMDARTLRELMERDQRRRDRKKALDSTKLKRKLQERLDKQKAEAAARQAAIELEGAPVPLMSNMEVEQFIPGLDNEQLETGTTTSRRDSETSGRWSREMSKEDLLETDPFADHPADSREGTKLSSEQVSIRDDAVIESATAVRLSTISMSPPASPMISREKTMSPSNLSSAAIAPRQSTQPSSSVAASGYQQSEAQKRSVSNTKQGSSWTSIFRRGGTKRKVSVEKEKESFPPSQFSNVSRESFLRKNQPPSVPVVQRSFQREPTVHRKQSKFREDLPELPISPPRSRMASPDLERPLSPYVDDTRKLDTLNNDDSVITPIEDVHPALRDRLSSGRQQSFQGPSPEPALLSQSLASIDSEASWLSGKPQKRSSIPVGSVRESLASLTQPLEENDDVDEPDFSRREFASNMMRGPGGLSSQFRGILSPSGNEEQSSPQGQQLPSDEPVKYSTVRGRRPNIIQRESVARSREGLLDEYNPNEEDSPVSPLSPRGDQDFSPGGESFIHRATSVKLGHHPSHARQLSAGSARLLDIPARSSSDAKRSSVVSASSNPRSPLVSPRDSVLDPK